MKKLSIISKDKKLINYLTNVLSDRHFDVVVFSVFSPQAIANIVLIDEDELNITLTHAYQLIQTNHEEAIVIALSSNAQIQTKAKLLDLGIDDYLQKPIQALEVIGRINSVSKRITARDNVILTGDLSLNVNHRTAKIKGQLLQLTHHEFLVLLHLAKNTGSAGISRTSLMNDIWGCDDMGKTRPIDNLIRRLRKKLMEANSETTIRTIWGEGYTIENQDTSLKTE